MKFRVVEKVFQNKSEFYPEWLCDDKNACNYGWNNVHDAQLMVLPTNNFEDAIKRIKWFVRCFKIPLIEIIS
jgi:hypothetical protein